MLGEIITQSQFNNYKILSVLNHMKENSKKEKARDKKHDIDKDDEKKSEKREYIKKEKKNAVMTYFSKSKMADKFKKQLK